MHSGAMRTGAITVARFAAGIVVAILLFEIAGNAYVAGLAASLDATLDVWDPPGLLVSAVESEGTVMTVHYVPDALRGTGRIPAGQFFTFDLAALGTWDFLVAIALFAGLASGGSRLIAVRFAITIAILVALDYLSFGCFIRYGYVPERDLYDIEPVFAMQPFFQQVVPTAVVFALCPTPLKKAMFGATPSTVDTSG